ncbi:hypothetical protein F4802DRAFT_490956 [Xylaria palmicola]|nr:hypothetical protein F4802DRAFT_490956 [Xylaria palmicola]
MAAETGAQPKVLRKLGGNEAYQLAMYILDQYRGTSVSCRYAIPPSLVGLHARDRLVRTVEAAISATVLKHAVLQLGILDADSAKPKWVQLDSLDLRQHVQWRFLDQSDDFEEALRETTTARMDATFPDLERQPGWNMVVLCQTDMGILDLLFTWNHPHGDGISGKVFQLDLFHHLNSPSIATGQRLDSAILEFPKSVPNIPPPIEQMMPFPMEFKWAIKTLWAENKPLVFCKSPCQADWAPVGSLPYKTQFRVFTVSQDILTNALVACRQHKTTLTGLFHALTLASLASHLEQKVAPGFTGATTVDMRRFLPRCPADYPWLEPEQTMGNYVTMIHHEFDTLLVADIRSKFSSDKANRSLPAEALDLVWLAAANVRGQIMHKLEIGVKNDVISLFKFVFDWRTQMKEAARRPRQASWMITGLGILDEKPNLDTPPSETWSLERAQFALSTETTAAALMISPMSVAGKGLCVGGSWQDSLFDTSLGERIMSDLQRWITQIGSPSN